MNITNDSIIIGGGFFGVYIANYLASQGHKVTLFEKESSLMERASYVNQARVHNGYHYPRSHLTALRSRASFPIFCNDFKECIDDEFSKFYMVGRILGKVTARQFQLFCQRIGAPCDIAPHWIRDLTNKNLIEEVFTTKEYAFDSRKLRSIMLSRLADSGVTIKYETVVTGVQEESSGLTVKTQNVNDPDGASIEYYKTKQVFNCTYSMTNFVLHESKIDLIPLKQELTEMCIVKVPDIFEKTGITVMSGPFFSVMPFPSKGLHSFSHVRYTPHHEWNESNESYFPSHQYFNEVQKNTLWRKTISDASRYIPVLSECEYKESIWEVKTLLPRSETDDSRPILFKANHGMKGLHCIMGGKIDNVYDVITVINELGLNK